MKADITFKSTIKRLLWINQVRMLHPLKNVSIILKCSLLLTLGLIFLACSNDDAHQMNGMWQLQSIEYPDGNKVEVDTVFYNFQQETVFSFISLINADSSSISYGYVDFPSPGLIHIAMDTTRAKDCNCFKNVDQRFLEHSGWDEYEKTFFIQLSDKKLDMRDNKGWIYSFKKH